MRRLVATLSLVGAALAMSAPAAVAAPPGLEAKGPGEAFVCDSPVGAIEVQGGNGRSAWVDDELYLALEIHVTGTFTPTGSTTSFPVEFHKVYGHGPHGTAVHCVGTISATEDDGFFQGRIEVWAVKVPGHR